MKFFILVISLSMIGCVSNRQVLPKADSVQTVEPKFSTSRPRGQ